KLHRCLSLPFYVATHEPVITPSNTIKKQYDVSGLRSVSCLRSVTHTHTHKDTNAHKNTHTHTLSLSHTHTNTHTHSHTHRITEPDAVNALPAVHAVRGVPPAAQPAGAGGAVHA